MAFASGDTLVGQPEDPCSTGRRIDHRERDEFGRPEAQHRIDGRAVGGNGHAADGWIGVAGATDQAVGSSCRPFGTTDSVAGVTSQGAGTGSQAGRTIGHLPRYVY